MILQREQVMQALERADLNESALYDDYSGRGMYGATCLGIVGSTGDAAKFLIALAFEGDEAALSLAAYTRTDDMGMSMITYWPNAQVQG